MLSLTISSTLGVLVLVCTCNFADTSCVLVGDIPHLQWQMVWPLVYVGRYYANLNYVWQMLCQGVVDGMTTVVDIGRCCAVGYKWNRYCVAEGVATDGIAIVADVMPQCVKWNSHWYKGSLF